MFAQASWYAFTLFLFRREELKEEVRKARKSK